MELFSLGVGHYTEKDIREAARAFTGWRTDGEGFAFDARLHDSGPKRVLGQSGCWDGGDVVRIVLEQPAAARFVVRKLYHFLISEKIAPSDSLLEPLCNAFRTSDYDIKGLVRTILASRHFYSAHAFRQRIKSPVEYVLGAVRAVYRPCSEELGLPQQVLVSRLAAMGQTLFAPPNVKGWPGGPAWLNTSTVLERDNFANALAMGTLWTNRPAEPPVTGQPAGTFLTLGRILSKITGATPLTDTPEEPAPSRAFDSARPLDDEEVSRPEEVVRALLDLHLPGGIRPEVRARLVAFIAHGNPKGPALERRVRETVHALLSMAEYQMA
jgi:hypothetical protein